MMKTTNQSPRCARASSSVLRYSTVVLLGAALVAAQGRIAKPSAQTNPNSSVKGPHVATLRSSDSPEGSRVVLSSDQSLNDYEAYRRGDRFYVKIPAADVPRADAIRGRGFADVKALRSGDSTIVSFRLLPGATARVEQRSNRLEIVFTVAGGTPSIASNTGRELPRSIKSPESNRNVNANNRKAARSSANKNSADRSGSATARTPSVNANNRRAAPSSANKNSADRSGSVTARNAGNSNLAGKTSRAPALASNSGSKPLATPLPSPKPSPSAKTPAPTLSPNPSLIALASPTTQPTPVAPPINQSRQDGWSKMKGRINYWILLAQLNPLPVAIGVVVLLLLFALFLFQRRRAKSPTSVRSSIIKSARSTTAKNAAPTQQPASRSESAPEVAPAIAAAAAAAGVMAVAPKSEAAIQEVAPAFVPDTEPLHTEELRRDRIAQVNEQAKKLMSGAAYDESVIGSDDRATRQLVGAELLSAIVGRSEARREHARAAFMKHGYFDDATRDLRIADSANERAAAARRLSFVNDREATPHLVGALDDPSPDVRRTAVEALMDLRDPAAIGPLNSLMQTENDRKVPRTVIKQAIDACATAAPDQVRSVATPTDAPKASADPSSQSIQTEREVIEL